MKVKPNSKDFLLFKKYFNVIYLVLTLFCAYMCNAQSNVVRVEDPVKATLKVLYENVQFYKAKTYSNVTKKKSMLTLSTSLTRIELSTISNKELNNKFKKYKYEMTTKLFQDGIFKDSLTRKIIPKSLQELIDDIKVNVFSNKYLAEIEIKKQDLKVKNEEQWLGVRLESTELIPSLITEVIFEDLELETMGGYKDNVYNENLFSFVGKLTKTTSIDKYFRCETTFNFDIKVYNNKILLKKFSEKKSFFNYDYEDIIEANPIMDEARMYIINNVKQLKP